MSNAEQAAPKPALKIGEVARDCIRKGMSNKQATEEVKRLIPTAKTTEACIAWYRNDMRKKGEVYKSPRTAGSGKADMSGGDVNQTAQAKAQAKAQNQRAKDAAAKLKAQKAAEKAA